MPYVKNAQIFDCPTSQLTPDVNNNHPADYPINTAVMVGMRTGNPPYVDSQNGCLANISGGPLSLGAADEPTRIPVIADGDAWQFPSWCHVSPRHNDGANVGLLDGHAKWTRRSQAVAAFVFNPRSVANSGICAAVSCPTVPSP